MLGRSRPSLLVHTHPSPGWAQVSYDTNRPHDVLRREDREMSSNGFSEHVMRKSSNVTISTHWFSIELTSIWLEFWEWMPVPLFPLFFLLKQTAVERTNIIIVDTESEEIRSRMSQESHTHADVGSRCSNVWAKKA